MRYLIYFLISILLISLQTTVIPAFLPLISLYDLLIPFTVFLVLFRPAVDGLLMSVFTGFAMDMLSGAPAGIYFFVYLLLFFLFRNARIYFHLRDAVLFQVVLVFGVLLELSVFGVFYAVSTLSFHFSMRACWIVITQILWAIITGRLVFVLLDNGLGLFDTLRSFGYGNNGLP